MNNDNINLLIPRKQGFIENKTTENIFRLVAIISLFVVSLSSIGLFLLKATSSLKSLKREQNTAFSTLSLYHERAVKFLLISGRANDVSIILTKRADFYEIVNTVTKEIPKEVAVDSMEVEKTKITMSLSSRSLSAIELLFDNLLKTKYKNKNFKNITLNGIFYDAKKGTYLFSLQLLL